MEAKYAEYISIALQAQGFNVDTITVKQFLDTIALIDKKGGKADIMDFATLQDKYDEIRNKKPE